MAKAKTESLNFSKFFPESTAFISVSGKAKGSDNYYFDIKIGDGEDSISINTSDWFNKDSVATLKAIQEGIQKAMDFQQKALKMPKEAVVDGPWNSFFVPEAKEKATKKVQRVLKSTETAVKKKAAK